MSYFKLFFLFLAVCLIISCSRTKEITSPYSAGNIDLHNLISDWPGGVESRVQTEHLDYYITNNGDFLFLRVDFRNNQIYNEARQFGFTVYFDSKDKFQRSFGITYPAGLVNQLAGIPGAQRAYFENPGWESSARNRNLIESLERVTSGQAMLMQRNDRRAAIRHSPISLNQIQAQGMDLALDHSSRNMSVVFKVPLQSSRIHQFALDVKPGQKFNLGFEIKAPSIDEIDPDKSIGTDGRRRIAYQLPRQYERWMIVKLSEGD